MSFAFQKRGTHSELRRVLVAPSELEEQRGCAVLAFREWLAPLAAKTGRALVVPPRFANLFNFTYVAKAWVANCGVKGVVHSPEDQAAFQATHKRGSGGLCAPNASSSFHLRIERDWGSGSGGRSGAAALVPCPVTASKRSSRRQLLKRKDQSSGGATSAVDENGQPFVVDRCLLLRGKASLHDLIQQVPELTAATPCFVITHGSRGFRVGAACSRDDWNRIDYTAPFKAAASRFLASQAPPWAAGAGPAQRLRAHGVPVAASAALAAKGHAGPQPYLAAHFRTEKWPSKAATSSACWAQVGRALGVAAQRAGLKNVFLGSDVGHSVSYGNRQTQSVVANHMQEQVIAPLQSQGMSVRLGASCKTTGQADSSVECATVDQLVMADAHTFLHMYGQAPAACGGASAGSCYGQWITRHRAWQDLPSLTVASQLPREDRGPLVRGVAGGNNNRKRGGGMGRGQHRSGSSSSGESQEGRVSGHRDVLKKVRRSGEYGPGDAMGAGDDEAAADLEMVVRDRDVARAKYKDSRWKESPDY